MGPRPHPTEGCPFQDNTLFEIGLPYSTGTMLSQMYQKSLDSAATPVAGESPPHRRQRKLHVAIVSSPYARCIQTAWAVMMGIRRGLLAHGGPAGSSTGGTELCFSLHYTCRARLMDGR